MQKLNEIAKRLEDAKAFMKATGKEALQEAFTEFFNKHPEATAIVWTQYVPYFNDGDPCVFSVHEAELKVDVSQMAPDVKVLLGYDEEEDEDDYGYGYGEQCAGNVLTSLGNVDSTCNWDLCARKNVSRRKLSDSEQSLLDDYCQLSKCLQSLEDLLQAVIGDDCLVRVTRDGIETEDYSHD